MKTKLGIVLLLCGSLWGMESFAQNTGRKLYMKNCGCKNNKQLNEYILCDTTFFDNGSKLYTQFNCDSSWLVFENKKGLRKILYSLPELIELTHRLGYQFEFEYKNSLLFQNRQASGGGFPNDYVLIDKENGNILEEFGPIIYYNDSNCQNYVLYFSTESLDTLTYFDIETRTRFYFSIPDSRISKTLEEGKEPYPEFLFEEPYLEDKYLILPYRYLISANPEKWGKDFVRIIRERESESERERGLKKEKQKEKED